MLTQGCEDDLRSRLNFLALGALVVVGILIFLEVTFNGSFITALLCEVNNNNKKCV